MKPLKVLFVEDDPFDAELIQNSLVGFETVYVSIAPFTCSTLSLTFTISI